jgi:hypothetical protein
MRGAERGRGPTHLLTNRLSSVLCREDLTAILIAEGLNQGEGSFRDYDYRLLGASSINYREKMLEPIVEHPVGSFRKLIGNEEKLLVYRFLFTILLHVLR